MQVQENDRPKREKKMKTKFPIIENAKRQAVTEKVLKFNRTALKNLGKVRKEKTDPRYAGGQDTMIVPVGKPGSRERVEELAKQYGAVAHLELSAFSFKGEDE